MGRDVPTNCYRPHPIPSPGFQYSSRCPIGIYTRDLSALARTLPWLCRIRLLSSSLHFCSPLPLSPQCPPGVLPPSAPPDSPTTLRLGDSLCPARKRGSRRRGRARPGSRRCGSGPDLRWCPRPPRSVSGGHRLRRGGDSWQPEARRGDPPSWAGLPVPLCYGRSQTQQSKRVQALPESG